MTQTKISKAYQTTISAEAIRILGLRPGMRVNQFVEGKRLILEPLEDVDSLAGSLGTGKRAPSVKEIKRAAGDGLAQAGLAGLEDQD
jgi:bifunctional DNA-binding transcriptional regulator/antitoxin component of YhaV-PrlF toxin-antitoxin module